jgi:hypothetical protein
MLETLDVVSGIGYYNNSAIQGWLHIPGSLTTVLNEEEPMAKKILPQIRRSSDYSKSENAGDRDNQQERLVRLGALIEAEGHLTIGVNFAGSTRYYMSLYPTIGFTNSNIYLVAEVATTLEAGGVEFVLRRTKGRGEGRKIRYDFAMHSRPRVTSTLNLVEDYIYTKREQAEILWEYLRSRESHLRSPYTDYEWDLCKRIRLLNGRMPNEKSVAKAKAYLESPESIRRPHDLENIQRYVKMCSELQRELERTPETSVPPILRRWVKK